MNELIREIREKAEKTPTEYELLRYYYTTSIVSDILVEVSKYHISYEDGIKEIRECLQSNL